MEIDHIQFGTTTITYELVRSRRRKNATITVFPDKTVQIAVPHDTGTDQAQFLMVKKAPWVIKKIDMFQCISPEIASKEYVSGETFLYLGRQYRLKILKTKSESSAKLVGKYLYVSVPESVRSDKNEYVKKLVYEWYRTHAAEKIKEVINSYCKRSNLPVPTFIVKNQLKRWGSCTAKNQLIFNNRIAMAPVSQLEYVVAHELCHMRYKDHSPKFWSMLKSVMPEYEKRKEALKSDGWKYEF